MRVLIAEDDEELSNLFQRVLSKNGYSVTGVSNGKEALEALENDYYDIIISDIMMPLPDMLRFKESFKSNNMRYVDVDTDDMYQLACLGFLKAVDGFDLN